MKRIACRLTYPTAFAVAAAVLFAFLVVVSASPARAASPEPGMAADGYFSTTQTATYGVAPQLVQ